MRWRRCRFLSLMLVLVFLLLAAGCARPSAPPLHPVDRKNPEAVVRAYFDAWARGDWREQDSLVAPNQRGVSPEPVNSIRILKLTKLAPEEPVARRYRIVFDIDLKGHGGSMDSGRYDWTFSVQWDQKRGSWFIVTYGAV